MEKRLQRWRADAEILKAFTDMENIIWKECTYTDMAGVIRSAGIPRRKHEHVS